MAGLEEYLPCIYKYSIWLAVDAVTNDIVSASHPAYREIYRVFKQKLPIYP